MVERLKFYIETQGMIASQFADAIGMPRSSFSQLLTGRNKSMSDVTIGKIHAAFPNLSISWLLFGEGSMLTDTLTTEQPTPAQQPQLSIFGENAIFATTPDDGAKYAQEIEVEKTPILESHPDVLMASEPQAPFYRAQYNPQQGNRHITHIVVYYNDNTFETYRQE